MNEANNFYLNKLENVVIIGFSQVLDELIKINETLKIKTSIVSSSDQSKNFKHKHKIFNEVNDELYEYISENFEIDKTLLEYQFVFESLIFIIFDSLKFTIFEVNW